MKRAALLGILMAVAGGLRAPALADEAYRAEIRKWREDRESRLKADGGWLTLAGLFWLKNGTNRFGTGPSSDIVLPQGAGPARAGVFEFDGGRTTVRLEATVQGRIGKVRVAGPVELKPDTSGSPDVLEIGPLSMLVIKRGERYGIRLKDNNSPIR